MEDAPDLVWLLRPQCMGEGRYEGLAGGGDPRRTFGGLLAAQALAAAAGIASGRACHSLHLLFLDGGDADQAVEISVERLRDGRSFAARQVRVAQRGRTLVQALASFHAGDTGPEHAVGPPDAPPPETLEDQRVVRDRNAAAKGGPPRRFIAETLLDLRPVELPFDRARGIRARRLLWVRSRAPLPADLALHQATIAFVSDIGLVHVGLKAHNELGGGGPLNAASLDHALWFHRARARGRLAPVRAGQPRRSGGSRAVPRPRLRPCGPPRRDRVAGVPGADTRR